jgi:hypothetical protein
MGFSDIRPGLLIVFSILWFGPARARAAEDGFLLEDRFEAEGLDHTLWNLRRGVRPGATYGVTRAEKGNNRFVQFLVLDDTPASAGGSSVELGAADRFSPAGVLTIGFDFLEPGGPLGGSFTVRALRTGARAVASRGNFAYSVGFHDGRVGDSKQAYSLDRIHHADIVINNTGQPVDYAHGKTLAPLTAHVWVDGELATTGVKPAMKGEIRGVGFIVGSSDRQAMAIDNVQVLRGANVVQASPSAAIAMAPVSEKQAARYSMAAWPPEPVMVSPSEGVIEAFWLGRVRPAQRWKTEGGSVSTGWDAGSFRFEAAEAGDAASISRTYDLDLAGYRRLRMRLRPGAALRTTIVATVDGREQTVVADAAGSDDALELHGPIGGEKLTGLIVRFEAEQPGKHNVQLRWILLEKDGASWTPPPSPFEGMIVEAQVGRFEPGLGVIFGAEELNQMRRVVQSPAFEKLWQADLQYAANQYKVEPASMIRPYSLYAFTRYGRDTDAEIETIHDGIMLALVGMITHNEDYLREAARHAVALAHIDHWSEGFVEQLPGHRWRHAAFAPNVATIKASLLLDWTWHYLTPRGRDFVRKAIAEKGLPYVEPCKNAMANQGVRFNKGMILGKMALADSFDEPALREYVRACIDRINKKFDAIVRPDGTFSEGMGYGKGTIASTPISYQAASRCLGVPVAELATPRMLPAMRFVLEAERGLDSAMAAFCAGPLGDETFASRCVPTGLIHDYRGFDHPSGKYTGNRVEYVFFGLAPLWATSRRMGLPAHLDHKTAGPGDPIYGIRKTPQPPKLPPFSVYRDGGWVFGGNDDPALPRFSFESGLWDGHGHHWFHKNAVTLDGWGERLLVARFHLGYQDARSNYTMQTKLYNTFAPSARNQNASGGRGRGAKLLAAEDLGPVAVVESDNATAWRSGVKRAVRRVLFFRPAVMVVHDDARFTEDEPGVQSWNSFQPWQTLDGRTCLSRAGKAAVRLTAVLPEQVEFAAGEDSVSREQGPEGPIEVPVYRAAFTSPAGKDHEMLTVVEAIAPGADEKPSSLKLLDGGGIELRQGQVVARLFPHPGDSASENSSGFTTDGRLLFVVTRQGHPVAAGAFGATRLTGPDGVVRGDEFLRWSASGGGTNK